MTKCSIDGCELEHEARGFCNSHYRRLLAHGDPLSGGAPRAPHGAALAWIERHHGYSGSECLIWPFARNSRGYCNVWRDGRTLKASRLMCERVHGPPPSAHHDAAHSCGKGHLGCLNPLHLSWKTKKENEADKIIHGTILSGERAPWSKLTESDVRAIRSMRGVYYQREIAAQYGISQTTVSEILLFKIWKPSHV